MYSIYVEDFMIRDVKYIWNGMTYKELKIILQENRNLRGFPLVDKPDSMILLGSMQRMELRRLIEKQVGRERRLQVVARWQKEAQQRFNINFIFLTNQKRKSCAYYFCFLKGPSKSWRKKCRKKQTKKEDHHGSRWYQQKKF